MIRMFLLDSCLSGKGFNKKISGATPILFLVGLCLIE